MAHRHRQATPLLLALTAIRTGGSAVFSSPRGRPSCRLAAAPAMSVPSPKRQRHQYPRPLHPGGFSLPPLVEDRLVIAANPGGGGDAPERTPPADILLVRPPDVESLWEWYAYTKRTTGADPSWGRVWPTALALARLVIRSMGDGGRGGDDEEGSIGRATDALRTASHAVEIGCGLGVAGLAFASAAAHDGRYQRTVTFLDREPYAVHCAVSSAAVNGWPCVQMAPLAAGATGGDASADNAAADDGMPAVTIRAAVDDWTVPTGDDDDGGGENDDGASPVKNVRYRDLCLEPFGSHDNRRVVVLASDVLYEPSAMRSLAAKIRGLAHPTLGGCALVADPRKERTPGCRDAFVESVEALGGNVAIFPMRDLGAGSSGAGNRMALLEGDVVIDGSLAEIVLIVVRFGGADAE